MAKLNEYFNYRHDDPLCTRLKLENQNDIFLNVLIIGVFDGPKSFKLKYLYYLICFTFVTKKEFSEGRLDKKN